MKGKSLETNREKMQRRLMAAEILSTLEENGFERCERLETSYGDVSEIVFAKPVKDRSRYIIAVYTSCNQVGGAYVVRKKGKDAIRIAGLYITKTGVATGIVKNKRVNRVGLTSEICKRITARIAKTTIDMTCHNQNCNDCGAPMFISKKNNPCCSEICWSKK